MFGDGKCGEKMEYEGCRYEKEAADGMHCHGCRQNEVDNGKYVKMTNADRVRNMTNEELSDFLMKVNTAYAEPCMTGEAECRRENCSMHDKDCKACFKEWLESGCDTK